jgi:hypothetical protein
MPPASPDFSPRPSVGPVTVPSDPARSAELPKTNNMSKIMWLSNCVELGRWFQRRVLTYGLSASSETRSRAPCASAISPNQNG